MSFRESRQPMSVTTSAYLSGDQLGDVITFDGALAGHGHGLIHNLTIIDRDKTNKGFTLFFFNSAITPVSTDNAALDIDDGDMFSTCIGKLSVATANYTDIASSSVATIYPTNPLPVKCAYTNTSGHIYAVAKADEGITFGAGGVWLCLGLSRG